MKDFLKEYPFVRSISMISESSFSPAVFIKFNNGEEIAFKMDVKNAGDMDKLEREIEREIKKQYKFFRKQKLERILKDYE